jgi:hypothetical protein
VDPVPDPLLVRKSRRTWNGTRTSGSVTRTTGTVFPATYRMKLPLPCSQEPVYLNIGSASLSSALIQFSLYSGDRLYGLVVRVLGYRSGGPGLITSPTKKKSVGLERSPLSPVITTEELLDRKVAAPVYKTENMAVGIRHAHRVA